MLYLRIRREEAQRRHAVDYNERLEHFCARCGRPSRGTWCSPACARADGYHREHLGDDADVPPAWPAAGGPIGYAAAWDAMMGRRCTS
jgi:hypothetical protein